MQFLKQAVKTAAEPKISVIKLLSANLGGWVPSRPYTKIHASALTKPDFCARKVALLDLTDKKEKEYLSTALQATFDVGKAIGELVVEKWLDGFAIGHWRCMVCGDQRSFCKRPPQCGHKDPSEWKYVEVRFMDPESRADGSLDLIIEVGAQKLMLYELKIIAPDEFEKLIAPLAEHRLRTSLYLGLVRKSESAYAATLNTDTGGVLYVSRAYGKKNKDHNGEILPFKEFYVTRDDASNEVYLSKAREVKRFRDEKFMPAPICTTYDCAFAKKCRVREECFSGEYPAS